MKTGRVYGRLRTMERLGTNMAEETPGLVEIAEAEGLPLPLLGQGDAADIWLCTACLNRVARNRDRHYHEGQSEFLFKNPTGIPFHILTFSETIGCKVQGEPTLDYTWFANHAWTYCLCDQCGAHLGWHYSGPTEFDGLIQARIVRALLALN